MFPGEGGMSADGGEKKWQKNIETLGGQLLHNQQIFVEIKLKKTEHYFCIYDCFCIFVLFSYPGVLY